ncbi:hypothetical protein C9J44_19915 [Photobacterium sp. GB-27]|uniref:hypothetical protein n=1 Tax=Photobacterium sp. GB-27 TaxID=2022109 RepID=UPI000D159467|nr:hypothetical protein [Photobacterium sp. GB-27]PSV31361.1 hypothetical protein C9J44_19915 [Photobacterium sp. GB-27]
MRPTHALSLEKCLCYGIKQAIHSDKGRYRVIYLCNYLQESIHYYLSIQKGLLTQLNIKTTSPYLWFLLDKDNQAQVLNAKIMRQFMQQHWPHRYLLNAIKKQPYSKWKALLREQFSTPPAWHHDNIVPTILYFFTYDLIQYGGVKAATLSVSSLSKYTNIYTILSNHPLTYIQACDHDGLMQWATTLYESIDSEGDRWLIYNFLRFLPQLSVTEHFDITQFSSPFFSLSVDPFRLSVDQCFITLEALLSQSNDSALQRLFCAVTLILGFYGALRPREVLRLRCQDIVCNPDNPCRFTLRICNTSEGNTKNKSTRFVYPGAIAKLVRVVRYIKRHCSTHNAFAWL